MAFLITRIPAGEELKTSGPKQSLILHNCQDDPMVGHEGVARTRARVLERYWWPGLGNDVDRHVSTRYACQVLEVPNDGILAPDQTTG